MTICYVKGCDKVGKITAHTPFGGFTFCDEHVDRAEDEIKAVMSSFTEIQRRLTQRLRELGDA